MSTPTQTPCPDEVVLQRFLDNELPEVEATRIDRHLHTCPACNHVLDRLNGVLPPEMLPGVSAGDPTDEGEPSLDGYEVREYVDAGGMGVVWRVRDLQFGRDLALKVLKSKARPDAVERFLTEARITARLTHQFIVPVHAMHTLADGRPCYTMKLVRGQTLADLIEDALPELAARRMEFVRIFSHVCQAVAYAHRQGVIHRDLKPGNVMVGEHGEVQVMDWGIAKELEAEAVPGGEAAVTETRDDWPALTHTCDALGTFAYMPPEQARGPVALVDRRADVFALGATLCEMLTGRPPYFGDKGDLERQAKEGDLTAAVGRLENCGAEGELIALARACLAVDPSQRPADGEVVADRVTAYLESVEERLRQAELERERMKTAHERRRRKVWVAGLVATIVVAIGGSLGLQVVQRRAAEELQGVLVRDARRLDAHLTWDRGRQLCEQGELGHGLLTIARALETAPQGDEDVHLREALRMELASWLRQTPTLQDVWLHPDKVYALAVSPREKIVLTGCADGKARLWDVAIGQASELLPGHTKPVRAVAFSNDGLLMITGSEDATAWLWDVRTRQRVGVLNGHKGAVNCLALSPDGKTALSGGANGTACLWDTCSCTRKGVPIQHGVSINAVAFSPDGATFLTGVELEAKNKRGQPMGEVRLWRTATGKPIGVRVTRDRIVRVANFSADGTRLLIGDDNYEATLWDWVGNKQIAEVEPDGSVLAMALSNDGRTMLTGTGHSPKVHLWSVAALPEHDGKPSGPALVHPHNVTGVAFVGDGDTFVTACEDGGVRVWRQARAVASPTVFHHSPGKILRCATFDPTGRTVATSGDDGWIRFWNAATGGQARAPIHAGKRTRTIAFTPEGGTLLADCRSQDIRSWDLRTGVESRPQMPSHEEVQFLTISTDGRWMLAVGRDGLAYRWEPGQPPPSIGPRQEPLIGGVKLSSLNVMTVDRQGRYVLAGDDADGKAQFWDANTGRRLGPGIVHRSPITATAFRADGRMALTGSNDGQVRLWDAATGEFLKRSLSHLGGIHSAVFSPDGQWVLTGGGEKVGSQLWAAHLGKKIGPRRNHSDDVVEIAFHPDGKAAVFAQFDGVAVVESIAEPLRGSVEEVVATIQSAVGLRLDEGGGLQPLDGASWVGIRKQSGARREAR